MKQDKFLRLEKRNDSLLFRYLFFKYVSSDYERETRTRRQIKDTSFEKIHIVKSGYENKILRNKKAPVR
jgi:hypothetical protein